jgi:hypothetical protein
VDHLHPCIPELKIKDYDTFRAFRCGICSQLREGYGFFANLILSNDLIPFALLTDGLAGREATVCMARCPRHWLRRHRMMCHTQGIRLAAQLNVLLAWHYIADAATVGPMEKCKRFLLMRLEHGAFVRACAEYPSIERIFLQEQAHAQALELAKNKSYEASWEPFTNIFSALFVYCAPDQSAVKALRRTGGAMGKILFLMRSIEEYARDKKIGKYNIFLENGLTYEAAREYAKCQCGIAAAEMANAYNLLNMKVYRSLLDNIMFQGLEECVSSIGVVKGRKRIRL